MQPWFTTPLDGRRSLLPRSCCRVCSRPGCSRRALNIECHGPFRNGATREKPRLQRRWICCSRKNILESFIALEFFFCFWGERTCRRIDNFPRAASRNRGTLFIFRRGCARCSTHNAIFQNHNSLLFADDWKEKQIGDSFSSREGWHEGYSRIYRCIATQLLFIGSRSLFIEAARARKKNARKQTIWHLSSYKPCARTRGKNRNGYANGEGEDTKHRHPSRIFIRARLVG